SHHSGAPIVHGTQDRQTAAASRFLDTFVQLPDPGALHRASARTAEESTAHNHELLPRSRPDRTATPDHSHNTPDATPPEEPGSTPLPADVYGP
ncbi:hypothetical protein, partial [Streptomyces albicerus]|uniref:hypothetical protein n=1 Tax=Streptomyces albicerus TaxID=2569859 RepID=UPI001CEC15E1